MHLRKKLFFEMFSEMMVFVRMNPSYEKRTNVVPKGITREIETKYGVEDQLFKGF